MKAKGQRGSGSLFRQRTSGFWWMSYYVGGLRKKESTGTASKADARQRLNQRLGEVAAGTRTTRDAGAVLVADLLPLVRRDYEAKGHRSFRRVDLAWHHIRSGFAGLHVADLSFARLDAYLESRTAAGAAPTTAAYELRMLKRALKLAVRAEWIGKADVPEFPSLAADRVRTGFFESADVATLVDTLPDYLRNVVRFAFITGWRIPSEVLTLTWNQVDDARQIVRLEPGTTKNGAGREFPFTHDPDLAAVLVAQRQLRDELLRDHHRIVPWVFHRHGAQIKEFRWAWKSALKRAKLPLDRIPHDLRRSAVRNLVRSGISPTLAKELTGHKTDSVFERYNITTTRDLEAAVAQYAAARARG